VPWDNSKVSQPGERIFLHGYSLRIDSNHGRILPNKVIEHLSDPKAQGSGLENTWNYRIIEESDDIYCLTEGTWLPLHNQTDFTRLMEIVENDKSKLAVVCHVGGLSFARLIYISDRVIRESISKIHETSNRPSSGPTLVLKICGALWDWTLVKYGARRTRYTGARSGKPKIFWTLSPRKCLTTLRRKAEFKFGILLMGSS
jgi:hypothetical protein